MLCSHSCPLPRGYGMSWFVRNHPLNGLVHKNLQNLRKKWDLKQVSSPRVWISRAAAVGDNTSGRAPWSEAGLMPNGEPPRPRGTKPCIPRTAGTEGTPSQDHGPGGHSSGCAWGVSGLPQAWRQTVLQATCCQLRRTSDPGQRVCKCFWSMRWRPALLFTGLVCSYSQTGVDWLGRTSGEQSNVLLRAGLPSELEQV